MLLEICDAAANTNNSVRVVPGYLGIVRQRMLKFLFNALAYNLNYKDLAHTNVEHMTNFFMYPLVCTPKGRLYPFFCKMFANTLTINGGYLDHCDKKVLDGGLTCNPFITRRDFDLVLLYFVLTGKIKLSVLACRSYLYKGSFNPLSDIYKCFLMALKRSCAIPMRVVGGPWRMANDGLWHMPACQVNLSDEALKVGLFYCGHNIVRWTPDKIRSLIDFALGSGVNVETENVPAETLISNPTGKYLIGARCGARCGVVINVRDCHPYVFEWSVSGLRRFDSPIDYVCSHVGKTIGRTVCRLIEH